MFEIEKGYAQPDDTRESWAFLKLKTGGQTGGKEIRGWQIAYANAKRLIRLKTSPLGNEKKIVETLIEELGYCTDNGSVLITFQNILPQLRTRMLLLGKSPNLRELRYVSLSKILSEFFVDLNNMTFEEVCSIVPNQIETHTNRETFCFTGKTELDLLWRLLKSIGPLIPRNAFGEGIHR